MPPAPASRRAGWGEGREGLKVERCTLNVGRPRVGVPQRCARTGNGGHGAAAERSPPAPGMPPDLKRLGEIECAF